MKSRSVVIGICLCLFSESLATAAEKPNVLLIVCDDLNDYIETLGGHPQAQTPNIERLSRSGVCFTQAHCNIPICAPGASARWAQSKTFPGRSPGQRVVRTGRSAHGTLQMAKFYDPAEQSYSLRAKDWRYIRYSNGKEELYHNAEDPYEWTNLASNPQYASKLDTFRTKLEARILEHNSGPKKTADEVWKDNFFRKHPKADANNDGTLSWPELRTHKAMLDASRN